MPSANAGLDGTLFVIGATPMATVKYQVWTDVTWNWDSASAGAPCTELLNEMRAWITAINGNASQTGRQVALLRDENSSTTANFRGFTIECPAQTTTGSLYTSMFSNTTTNMRYYTGTSFTDDTSNGGYGTVTGTIDADIGILWKQAVTTTGAMITGYSTVNGEEFFHVGWNLDNATGTSDHITIFKDQNGEWGSMVGDTGTEAGLFWDEYTSEFRQIQGLVPLSNSSILGPVTFYTASTGVNGVPFRYVAMIKSADIFSRASAATQTTYSALSSGDNVICSAYYGLWLRYTPA